MDVLYVTMIAAVATASLSCLSCVASPADPLLDERAIDAGASETAPPSAPPTPDAAAVSELWLDVARVELVPSRTDRTVAALWVRIQCHQSIDLSRGCEDFVVSGAATDGYGALLEYPATDTNLVTIPRTRLAFSIRGGGFLCIAVRAIWNEVSHQDDSDIYVDREDRYSLVSYCSNGEPPEGMPGRFPFTHKREETLEAFVARLSAPIPVDLK